MARCTICNKHVKAGLVVDDRCIEDLKARLAQYVELESDGRILPQGFSCVESSGNKNLLMFHPKGRGITHDVNQKYTCSG